MAVRSGPPVPSPKLVGIQKDFQQIASMAGFLNSAFDLPQLRLLFTLYGRVTVSSQEEGQALLPQLQAWCDRLALYLREQSSSAILPPQVSLAAPQPAPGGAGWYVVATLSFNTKVTENSYLRVRTAVLSAYQAAVALREGGTAALTPVLPPAPEAISED